MAGGKRTVEKKSFTNVKLQVEIAEWLCGMIPGGVGFTALFGEVGQERNMSVIGSKIKALEWNYSRKEKQELGTWIAFEISEKSSNTKVGVAVASFNSKKTSAEYVVYEMKHSNPAGEAELEELMNNRHEDDIETFFNKNKMNGNNPETPLMAAQKKKRAAESGLQIAKLNSEARAIKSETLALENGEENTSQLEEETNGENENDHHEEGAELENNEEAENRVAKHSQNNGNGNEQDPMLQPPVDQVEAKKTTARLKAVIACLLVILAIGILLVIIRFTRLMILEPIEQPATEAPFRAFLSRALNGLSHCLPAFAQYFNATGQH